jgi:hypothetical protein
MKVNTISNSALVGAYQSITKMRGLNNIKLDNIKFNIYIIFTKNQSQPTLLYLLIWRFELQVSACYGHHQAALQNTNTETRLSERGGLPLHSGLKYTLFYIYKIR